MDAMECIRTRRSVRKFQPKPVPKDLLREIIKTAQWSPSYKNSQPWEVMVLSGARKEALSKMLAEILGKGTEPCPDIPEPQSWPPAEEARIAALYKKRAETTGIDLNDPEVLKKAKIVNFHFYDAPHAIYLFQDASLTPWSLFDMGLFAQSLMLAAHARGLGTVAQAFATDYAKDTKEFLNIPETKRLVLGISIGYPDRAAEADSPRTDRSETGEILQWVE